MHERRRPALSKPIRVLRILSKLLDRKVRRKRFQGGCEPLFLLGGVKIVQLEAESKAEQLLRVVETWRKREPAFCRIPIIFSLLDSCSAAGDICGVSLVPDYQGLRFRGLNEGWYWSYLQSLRLLEPPELLGVPLPSALARLPGCRFCSQALPICPIIKIHSIPDVSCYWLLPYVLIPLEYACIWGPRSRIASTYWSLPRQVEVTKIRKNWFFLTDRI